MSITLDNLKTRCEKVKKLYNEAQEELTTHKRVNNEKYVKCIELSNELITFFNTLNPFQINRSKDVIKDVYFICAEVLLRTVGINTNRGSLTDHERNVLYTSISHLQKCLNIEPFHPMAQELYKIIFIYLTIFNIDAEENIKLLKNVLLVQPADYQLHYNLGFTYQRVNKLDEALGHLKMSCRLIEMQLELEMTKKEPNQDVIKGLKEFKVKTLNSMGGVYFSIQDRELANYYFYEALKVLPEDPDIHNQIGVVYTELRLTDKAIYHYEQGIANVKKAHISTDKDMLLASMYMNMGLAYCYEINYPKAIECYNKALEYKPRLSLAYQNKLLDLNYISHLIEDPMYIAKLHFNINKIYEKVETNYKVSCPNYQINKELMSWSGTDKSQLQKTLKRKIKIGFVSGDFICHPVSYFIHGVLRYINYDLFEVHCFSMKVLNINDMFPKSKFHVVKGTNPQELKTKIQACEIDILFDLSSQTGDNRLDTFILKPAPIQISYCGYPNTSGLKNMDYHITDKYADSDGVSPGPGGVVRPSTQKYYSEKLIFMDNCFLTYTSSLGNDIPALVETQPCIKNGYLTIGTFNRYNKINDTVVALWERVLEACPNVRFVIKTKEFLTPKLKEQFLNTWKNKKLLERITIMDYSDTYTDHLPDYNKMDIALDTFPYSGTTTTAEALMMGVPVLTLFDSKRQYHAQNVSSSFMINCDLEEYVVFDEDQYIEKIKSFSENLETLKDLKTSVRKKFLDGPISNHQQFTNEFEDKLITTYKNHKW
jgi:protein O-GlcNAc transferase